MANIMMKAKKYDGREFEVNVLSFAIEAFRVTDQRVSYVINAILFTSSSKNFELPYAQIGRHSDLNKVVELQLDLSKIYEDYRDRNDIDNVLVLVNLVEGEFQITKEERLNTYSPI